MTDPKIIKLEPSSAAESLPSENNPENKKDPSEKKPEPTRYGDWEKSGRCIDF